MRSGAMNLLKKRSARWFAPIAAALAIAAVTAVSNISAGASTPDLPSLTAQQLLVKVHQADVPAFSGTVQVVANLGLPDLSSIEDETGSNGGQGGGFNPLTWLSGTHTAQVERAPGATRVRVEGSLSEQDLIANESGVWLWDSTDSTATHFVFSGAGPGGANPGASGPGTGGSGGSNNGNPGQAPVGTPAQAADHFLAEITPSTSVSVSNNIVVAGRPAYQLDLVPKTSGSTIGEVSIAVDSATGMPLEVSVIASGAATPALLIGFTSFSTTAPPSADFDFTPGPGVKVTTHEVGPSSPDGSKGSFFNGSQVLGHDWSSVLVFKGFNQQEPANGTSQGSGNTLGGLIDTVSTPVSGSFGTGRLLQSNLINAVMTSDGRLAIGFVTPASIESALAPNS
jgi:hypothetical protein